MYTITLANLIYLCFSIQWLSNQLQVLIFSLSSEAISKPFLFGQPTSTAYNRSEMGKNLVSPHFTNLAFLNSGANATINLTALVRNLRTKSSPTFIPTLPNLEVLLLLLPIFPHVLASSFTVNFHHNFTFRFSNGYIIQLRLSTSFASNPFSTLKNEAKTPLCQSLALCHRHLNYICLLTRFWSTWG